MGAKALMVCRGWMCEGGEGVERGRQKSIGRIVEPTPRADAYARTHPDARLDGGELGLGDEVDLVEDDAVGEGELLDGLVLHALGLVVVEVLDEVLGVHHREDGVEAELLLLLLWRGRAGPWLGGSAGVE
jgi:hypothetical protein